LENKNNKYISIIIFAIIGGFLFALAQWNFLFFHTLAELFSIMIGFMIFIIAFNTKKFVKYRYFQLLGIGFLFLSSIDLLHTLSYEGMNIFDPVLFEVHQLWILARYMEAGTILAAFTISFSPKKFNTARCFIVYLSITIISLTFMALDMFPAPYIDGVGTSNRIIVSEIIIISIFALSLYFIQKRRKFFDTQVFYSLNLYIFLKIISEFSFIFFSHSHNFFNTFGLIFKIIAMWYIFQAVIATGLRAPQKIIFHDLIQKQESLLDLASRWKLYGSYTEFINKLFWYLFYMFNEFDSGFIFYSVDGKMALLDARGYDVEILKSMSVDFSQFFIPDVSQVMVNKREEFKKNLSDDNYDKLIKATKPWKHALVIPLKSLSSKEGAIFLIQSEGNDNEINPESIQLSKFLTEFLQMVMSIREQGETLYHTYRDFSRKLAQVAEAYDEDTGNHIIRVGELSGIIARKMGLSETKISQIRDYAPLHDVGKIFVSTGILKKPSKLTDEEWDEMKKHTVYAKKLLAGDDYFKTALKIALYHHENYDGSGYPEGLSGEDIPIEAAVVAIVDVYDALRSKRPYKTPFSHERAVEIISKGDGRTSPAHFNPKILKAFVETQEDLKTRWDELR